MASKDLATKEHWDSVYNNYGGKSEVTNWKPSYYLEYCLERILLNAIKATNAKTILEVGCGNSSWLPYLAKKTEVKVYGIDYSEVGCDMARQRLINEGVEGTIRCADVYKVAPEDVGQFDLVFSLGLVEHFESLENILVQLNKFVKPGGTLLTEVPNLKSIHGLLSWIYQPQQLKKHKIVTKKSLINAYKKLSLTDIESNHVGVMSLGIVAWGYNQRFPKLDKFFLPLTMKIVLLTERVMGKLNNYHGNTLLSPFLYIIGNKSK